MTDPIPSPTNPSATLGRPGIATGMHVTASIGVGYEKQVDMGKLSNRHALRVFDPDQSKWRFPKVKQRIEHAGQKLLAVMYKEDSRLGTEKERFWSLLVLSEWQEVQAADERGAPARWIAARDLEPGRHVLKLAINDAKGPWAEIMKIEPPPPKWEKFQNVPVQEIVLIDSDSYVVNNVLCRATSVPAPPPVKKRLVYPLKDFPLLNFVPQPETLSLAQAEIWYRKSAALLPRCAGESADPLARVRAMLDLKQRMREVAAKAAIETKLCGEFIKKHPLPALEELVPDAVGLAPDALQRAVTAAVDVLAAPGDRRYSEFTGGMEGHRVWSSDGYWEFDGDRWVLSAKPNQ
ncbi:hypothetical protein [Pseudothauera rhizosphaerae]|uniref:Uncharacterized protein n=1 Tax=Pseudothauera rhizosphaerae TaxID=2565932 RepID=A0A4S4AFW3_9RHOO|nr:hypothetical protein [Pseudothauera rhizosphaerae]THF58086.1 hypothetical protein E6O51_17245 [Pseudothauera rhizosphaerae]